VQRSAPHLCSATGGAYVRHKPEGIKHGALLAVEWGRVGTWAGAWQLPG
jgi:hypothetical protein